MQVREKLAIKKHKNILGKFQSKFFIAFFIIFVYRISIYPNIFRNAKYHDDQPWYLLAENRGIKSILVPDLPGYNVPGLRLIPLLGNFLSHFHISTSLSNELMVQILISLSISSIFLLNESICSSKILTLVTITIVIVPIEELNYLQNFAYVFVLPLIVLFLNSHYSNTEIRYFDLIVAIFFIEKIQIAIFTIAFLAFHYS